MGSNFLPHKAMLTSPIKLINGSVADPSNSSGQSQTVQVENGGYMDESESAHQYGNGNGHRCSSKESESCSSSQASSEMESELTVSSPREEEKTETEVKETSQQPKILLVEDNKINIMVAKSMMKQLGYTMDIANNGVEAINAVKDTSYDLVLMVSQLVSSLNLKKTYKSILGFTGCVHAGYGWFKSYKTDPFIRRIW